MKQIPNEYAEMLIKSYSPLVTTWDCYNDVPVDDSSILKDACKCAINDVNNTIEALRNTGEFLPFDTNYYIEVLNILKSKL